VEGIAFCLTTLSVVLFYSVAHQEVSSEKGTLRWTDFPALMAFGVGMCVNNTRAVLEAMFNVQTEFLRTAKFNIRSRKESWRRSHYRVVRPIGGGEVALGLYLTAALFWALNVHHYAATPFLALFLMGYLYVGALSLRHALHRS
jgi:hypothetical protein